MECIRMINVTIFNEFIDEKCLDNVKAVYPDGIHMALKNALADDDFCIKTVTMDDANCGLDDETLENTDVMLWWGHVAQQKVPDEVAIKVQQAVLKGMGFIALHSGIQSKPMRLLLGTPCSLNWREDGDYEFLWVCNPSHPIAKGVDRFIKIEHEETVSEPLMIPEPDELVFISAFEGGEAFRSGCCFRRGYGKIFYFQPGHEEFPTYKNPQIADILKNAVRWAKSEYKTNDLASHNVKRALDE